MQKFFLYKHIQEEKTNESKSILEPKRKRVRYDIIENANKKVASVKDSEIICLDDLEIKDETMTVQDKNNDVILDHKKLGKKQKVPQIKTIEIKNPSFEVYPVLQKISETQNFSD